jgi:MoxR-like ATPase
LQAAARAVHVSPAILDYVQSLLRGTRERTDIRAGLSPRAGQGLIRAAQAWALLTGRDAVLPDDVQAVFVAVANHRLERRDGMTTAAGRSIAQEIVGQVSVPV